MLKVISFPYALPTIEAISFRLSASASSKYGRRLIPPDFIAKINVSNWMSATLRRFLSKPTSLPG
jgi:hypothetical protein